MENWDQEREKIIGLGQQSIRKSYYPILKARLKELERFRQMLEHSVDGIVVVSLSSGIIMDANNAAARMLSIPLSDMIGAKYEKIFRSLADQSIRNFLYKKETSTLLNHRVQVKKENETTTLELNLNRETVDGESIVVAIFRDISSRIEIEKKLKKARDDANAASQAKSDFLAVISHEMRTPLNPILGFSHLLKDLLDGGPEAEYVDHIIEAGNRQLELVNDILNYTAMDRGSLTSQWTEFNLYEVCQCALQDQKPKAEHLDLSLEMGSSLNPLDPSLTVTGEQSMLLRILDNLLSNACKYTEEGSVKLKVKEQKVDNVTSQFLFEVIDTGIGIKPEMQESMFEAFTQADSSHKRSYEGIGLGLAICKKLVSFLKGEISCKSNPGEGSTFSFRLPMRIVTSNDPARIEKDESESAIPSNNALRVLIVEDRKDNVQLLEALLKKNGILSESVENGKLATERCMQQTYDCILMDLSMPEMTGIDATTMIRKEGRNQSTPIIAITADVTPGIEESCRIAGFDAYLSKPIKPGKLTALIIDLIKRLEPTG